MQWIGDKFSEIFSEFWVKLIALIPVTLLAMDERESVMLFAFTVIITVDCVFGVMVAVYCNNNFRWDLLGKKFSKKFLLYFFTLLASFILHNAYEFMEWWFYTIGTIIVFSEFGSLMLKAERLGLPVKHQIIVILNEKIDNAVRGFLGIECKEDCSLPRKKRR